MARIIKVAGLDMTMANTGAVRFALDLDTLDLSVEKLVIISTEKAGVKKSVRASSDRLRRAVEVKECVFDVVEGCTFVFSEVPTGSQSSSAAWSFGIAIGIMACLPVPMIQVQPDETKMASVGKKTATKAQMIEWAHALYPAAAWIRAHGKPAGALVLANEHGADACAVVHAGMRTEEFKRARAMIMSVE